MSLGRALAQAARQLDGVSDTPRLDAELLMAHALGETREEMLLAAQERPVPDAFADLLARRLAHEPVAYITGHRDFWTITLAVTPAVLIPRPDSETLIEAAVAHFGPAGPRRVLDLGTGSGALLLAALSEWPAARGLGIDTSRAALDVARGNAERLGLAGRAEFATAGWDAARAGEYDLVLCNPPYVEIGAALPADVVRYEPHAALFAGPEGLDEYRAISQHLRLPSGGVACVEIGAGQGEAVSGLFAAAGFLTWIKPDLCGRDRCVVVTRAG
jgi:release factor glutamine methyltransferase